MPPRRHRSMLVVLVFALLPALLLACRSKKTPSLESRVPVSQQAADRLEQKLKESIERKDNGDFILDITDVELTSYVVLKMATQIDRSEDMPLEDFQARFTDEQMIFSGRLTSVCPFSLNVTVVASAEVEDGQLDVSVDKAQVGAIPISKGLLKSLSRIISETIVEAPERMERAVEITDVEIEEGVMRLSGRVTKSAR